jgi:hypothetical protein
MGEDSLGADEEDQVALHLSPLPRTWRYVSVVDISYEEGRTETWLSSHLYLANWLSVSQ